MGFLLRNLFYFSKRVFLASFSQRNHQNYSSIAMGNELKGIKCTLY